MQLAQLCREYCRLIAAACCLGILAVSAAAQTQQSDEMTSFENVQLEFSEAFQSIAQFTALQRDEALAALDATLQRLDAQIEKTEKSVRD